MSTTAREKRVRRALARNGYRLTKLRGDQGYWVLSADSGGLLLGESIARGVEVGYSLDAVEEWMRVADS